MSKEVYICPVCERESMYSDLCDWCYQVESNIEHYLSTKEGIRRIQEKLKFINNYEV